MESLTHVCLVVEKPVILSLLVTHNLSGRLTSEQVHKTNCCVVAHFSIYDDAVVGNLRTGLWSKGRHDGCRVICIIFIYIHITYMEFNSSEVD